MTYVIQTGTNQHGDAVYIASPESNREHTQNLREARRFETEAEALTYIDDIGIMSLDVEVVLLPNLIAWKDNTDAERIAKVVDDAGMFMSIARDHLAEVLGEMDDAQRFMKHVLSMVQTGDTENKPIL